MTVMPPKKKQHYVDNKKFLSEIVKYREAVETAQYARQTSNLGLLTTLGIAS